MALLDIATIYNAAETDPIFLRFQAACLIAARDVRAESDNTLNHANRLSWAVGMLTSDLGWVRARVYEHIRYAISSNGAFQTAGVDIIDGDIQFIVNSQIDLLAG